MRWGSVVANGPEIGGVATRSSYAAPGASVSRVMTWRSASPAVAACATSASAGSVIRNLAPLSRSTNSTSGATMRKLTGTNVSPAYAQAK